MANGLYLSESVSYSVKRKKFSSVASKSPPNSQLWISACGCFFAWVRVRSSHTHPLLSCPGVCTGSSTRHIVTFDGRNFKLTGNCSYVLFHNKEQDLEVILHNGFCSAGARQACMKSVEVKQNGLSVELRSNMEVRGAFRGPVAGPLGKPRGPGGSWF